ncbi:HipA N-terminal domain-containing protein [Bradyrhizobium australiense]|uniref:HipA N-terminal domain-containing protein n=1 Tax=Bradyrhizobium australiense TaxID=2721161 RepID=UPI00289EC737|nr:HipA N-terminal domain-containing protein [Bradyrhizobium australiense]
MLSRTAVHRTITPSKGRRQNGSLCAISDKLILCDPREDAFRGKAVTAVFDNLLPDLDALRRRVAQKVGAAGTDAYSLLAAIGRDCVGALQFVAEDDDRHGDGHTIAGDAVDDEAIEKLLKGLAQAPLGLTRDDDFRISLGGAQEKTALLRNGGKWLKPHGTTPTTHIFKTQIGELPNGIDLSNSVENESHRPLRRFNARMCSDNSLPIARRSAVRKWQLSFAASESCRGAPGHPQLRVFVDRLAN